MRAELPRSPLLPNLLLVVLALCSGRPAASQQASTPPAAPLRVVLIAAGDFLLPGSQRRLVAVRETMLAGSSRPLESYRLSANESEVEQVAFLRHRYRDHQPDLVMPESAPALTFALQNRQEIWPGVPVVFYAVPDEILDSLALSADITGVSAGFDIAGTLDLALELQPSARRLVHVGGVSEFDRSWPPRIAEALARHPNAPELVDFSALPLREVLVELGNLPADTIVFYSSMFRDASGGSHVPRDLVAPLAAASSAPLYGAYDMFSGLGIVAGSISDSEEVGRAAGRLALRVLAGEDPSSIPIEPGSLPRPWADWGQIRRFGLDPDRLPRQTILGNRPASPWETHRGWILGGALLFLVQSALCAALVTQSLRRRRAERRVTERGLELAHASRLAMAGELTASITHEINQPLGAILSNADAAEMMLDQDPTRVSEVREILADIRRDDLRASAVIRQLRELLRRREPELQPLELNTVVIEALALAEVEATHSGIVIHTNLASDLPQVRGDRVQLEQVLLILTLNGLAAMAATTASDRRLSVSTGRTWLDTIEVTVSDRGHGIAEERLPLLFESFFTTKREGMGLGLSIARFLVEAHGGEISAANRPGGGATFTFTIPIASASQPHLFPARTPLALSRKSACSRRRATKYARTPRPGTTSSGRPAILPAACCST
jgi:signal transduction histidine kinase